MERREIHWEPRALARLVDDAPLAIYVKDARGRVAYANEAFADALGRPLEEVLGRPEDELFPRSLLQKLQRNDRWVMRHGRQLDVEEVIVLGDGAERTFLTHRIPLRTDSGEAVAVVAYSMEITERKRIERHLRRREASLAEAQQIAGVGSWSWDIEADEVRWSDEMYRIAGVSAEGFTPSFAAWLELIDDGDRERVLAASDAALAGRRPFEVRHRLRRPSGETRVVHCRGEVKRAPDGRASRFHGTCLDVTDAWNAQERLRRSQSRLAEAQRLARLGSFEWDYDMDVMTWSDELARILGLDPATVPPEPAVFLEAVEPADRERLRHAVQTALDERTPFELELRVRRTDGRRLDITCAGRAVTVDREGPPVLTGVVQDVTGRTREAGELRERLTFVEATFDAIPVAVGAVDRGGRWLVANRAMQRLTGREASELVGRSMADLLRPSDRAEHESRFDLLRRGEADELACFFESETAAGRRVIEARLAVTRPLREDGGHVVVTARDITDPLSEERVRAARLRLAEISAAGGDLSTLLETAGVAAGARHVRLWLREGSEVPLRLAAAWTAQETEADAWAGAGAGETLPGEAAREALRSGVPVVAATEEAEVLGDVHAVPVEGDGDVVGVVELVQGEQRPFDAVRRSLLDALAHHCSEVVLRRRSEDDLRHRALHDPLTGLPNRVLFADRLEQALARMRRDRNAAALLFIDCDDFKDVNDRHGHAAGDDALRAVAAHIAGQIRPGDTIARVGGDEFVVLAERVAGSVEAVGLCERLLRDVVVPVGPDGDPLRLTLSVGACLFDGTAPTAASVLDAADAAMYEAKTAGGDRCRVVRRSE